MNMSNDYCIRANMPFQTNQSSGSWDMAKFVLKKNHFSKTKTQSPEIVKISRKNRHNSKPTKSKWAEILLGIRLGIGHIIAVSNSIDSP